MYTHFLTKLKQRLNENLPGESLQYKMAPSIRRPPPSDFLKQINPKPSAVLILIYPKENELYTVLMQRPDYEGMHSGQVSFPGGKRENSDISILDTASREAWEEVGIDPGKTELIGPITDLYVAPSNFRITPVIAFSPQRPEFVCDPQEVAGLIETSLKNLTDPCIIKSKIMYLSDGFELDTPYYDINGKVVWGATAMILSEFIQIINEIQTDE